jgi:hypothetical protein
MRTFQRTIFAFLIATFFLAAPSTFAQSAGSSGTITGAVVDSSSAAIPGATVVLQNSVSGFSRTLKSDASGLYQITNIPFNPYRVFISSPGFGTADLRVIIRSTVPTVLNATLQVAANGEEVTVQAGGDLVENSATFHVDIDRELFSKLPLESQSSSVSSLLTLASPGVAADSNGLFHGLGDHAENAFYVDGQPITDQQSKVFSNQLPLSAIQSLEVIPGAPPAEYGEKTSLVANITTRSGQGLPKPRGEIVAAYGTFGSSSVSTDLALGSQKYGNFVAFDFLNTGRFLDPAEFAVFHDKGNVENFFDRVDFVPTKADSIHVNVDYTRSWFQTPNTYDSLGLTDSSGNAIGNTDQRSKIGTFSIAPSFTHTLNDRSNLSLILFVRRDDFNYFPSKNPLADLGPIQQESISQNRSLTNSGGRLDYSYVHGIHNIKIGGSYQQTFLNEAFSLGIVNPLLNSPCVDATGTSIPGFTSPRQCAAAGFFPNITANPTATAYFKPLLGCLDLTRPNPSNEDACPTSVATPFLFRGHTDVKLASFYGQDTVTLGKLSLNLGLRGDFYNALTTERQAEPRVGVSYNFEHTGTVLRASYARTLETPFNENLVLSSRGCNSDVISALVPCVPANFNPGFRNEFHTGLEQSVGKHFVVNGDYLWKYTHNGYDFSVLGATPITFPIEWHNAKISGFALKASVPNIHGLSAFVVMSSVQARFFPPQIGGLGATNNSGYPFRIDHDEKFNQTTNILYQYKRTGPYFSFNWRFDSGLVAGRVPFAGDTTTPVDLSGLTADQQIQAGLRCGTQAPTLTNALTTCAPSLYHSTLVSIPAPGKENDDHNPPRIAPRNLFDLSVGQDSIHRFKNDSHTLSVRLTATNLTNKLALYNFLSTFSGTHYVSPRAVTAEIGFHF